MIEDQDLSDSERALLDALRHLPPVPRPDTLADQFHARARLVRLDGRAWRPWVAAALAAMLVLTLGGGWWRERVHHQSEVAELRAQLIDALNGTSAPRRYEAVNVAGNSGLRDQQIVDALARALLTDPSA